MATTTTPGAVAAPAAPAPSAPASAPASTTTTTPTPVTAPAAAPPAAAPPITPPAAPPPLSETAPPPPPAAAPQTPGSEPKASDFPNDAEGQEAFLNAHNQWEREGGTPAPVEETKPPVEETKPAEAETKPAEAETEEELAEPVAVTPERVNSWLEKSPALKAALEADPVIKGELYQMARINAKAAPILEIMPSPQYAKFANDQANLAVGIRNSFRRSIDSPETFPQAFQQFADQFRIVDEKGDPVLDAAGNETFDRDFHMLMNYPVDSWIDDKLEELKKQAQAGDDEDANMALSAFEFIKTLKAKDDAGPQPPDPATLTPAQRQWQQQMEAELRARGEKLDSSTREQKTAQTKAERAAYTKQVNGKIGHAVGSRLDQWLAEKAQANVFLPSYVTEAKNKDGQSMFAIQIFNEFNAKVQGVAYINEQLAMLERLPPSPENEKARVDFYVALVDDFMPDIMEKHLRQVQRSEIADRKKRKGQFDKRKEVAVAEPVGGSASASPIVSTEETLLAQAYKNVDAKYPDLLPAERLEKALTEKFRLQRAG
jgi:hypothetical protein